MTDTRLIEMQLHNVKDKLSTLDAQFKRIEEKFDKMESTLSSIETYIKELKEAVYP